MNQLMSQTPRYFCMDVDYRADHALAAGVLFSAWESDSTLQQVTTRIEEIEPYESGKFYKRELPCLTQLIAQLPTLPTMLIVDSFVYLDDQQSMALGAYLWEQYGRQAAVIGVAKKRFKGNQSAVEIFRGSGKTPLFITSAGIELNIAATHIQNMHGNFRIPTLLKQVDQLCRSQ